MRKSVIKIFALLMSVLMLVSGCGKLVKVTQSNKSYRTINSFDSPVVLFDGWKPLNFKSGEAYRYFFEINTGVNIVDGHFELSVGGRAPKNLKFAWKYTIGFETMEGGCYGTTDKFYEKLGEFSDKNPLTAMVFSSLIAPFEYSSLYTKLVSDFSKFDIGSTLEAEYKGVNYKHRVESKESIGGIDGYTMMTSRDDIPLSVITVSPFVELPTYSLFFSDEKGEEAFYIMCSLEGVIIPDD